MKTFSTTIFLPRGLSGFTWKLRIFYHERCSNVVSLWLCGPQYVITLQRARRVTETVNGFDIISEFILLLSVESGKRTRHSCYYFICFFLSTLFYRATLCFFIYLDCWMGKRFCVRTTGTKL